MTYTFALNTLAVIKEYGMANGIHRDHGRDDSYGRGHRYWRAWADMERLFPDYRDLMRACHLADAYYLRKKEVAA